MKRSFKPYDPRQVITCNDTEETITGDKYLSSKHWKIIKNKIYDKYSGECQKCHSIISREKADIHHITYKRLGNEKESDLILYCKNCHTNVHNQKKRAKETNKNIQIYITMLDDAGKQDVINYIKSKYDFE